MADNMTLDSATLRSVADIIIRYCHVQNATMEQYLRDIYNLSDSWRDDETFAQMAEEIRLMSINSQQYFQEICNTYPPLFRKMADYIDSRPVFNGSGSVAGYGSSAGVASGSAGSSGHRAAGFTTDLSGKVEIPNNLAATVDFGHLDPQVSKVIVGTIMQTQEMFPDLKLNYVGSIQARNRAITANLVEQYCTFLRSQFPDCPEETILSAARKRAAEDMKSCRISSSTLAVARVGSPSDDPFFGISFNESAAWDAGLLNDIVERDVQTGFSAKGCYGAKAVMDHELGHIIDQMVDASNDPEIKNLFAQFTVQSEADRRKGLSGYANENIAEFIAEGWAEYRNNPACREIAQKIAKRMITLYQNKTDNDDTAPPVPVRVKTR